MNVTRALDTPRQRVKSICHVRVAYEALSRRTYGVPFLSIAYQIRSNGVSWRMYCVRTAYGRRPLRSRGVSTTIARRYISYRHVNAIIASKITSELKIAADALLWSSLQNERQRGHVARLRPGRNIVHGPIVGRAAKPRIFG